MNADQDRLLIELADLYDVWICAKRFCRGGRLRWKTINGQDYLYFMREGSDIGSSLGPRSLETEKRFEMFEEQSEVEKTTWKRLLVKGRMLKAMRVPMVSGDTGEILRALDEHELMGETIRIVGSNAMPAYEIASGVKIDPALRATEDVDLTWVGESQKTPPISSDLLDIFKGIDPTWSINQERDFQLRNRHGTIVDLLIAPSISSFYPKTSKIHPIETIGQDILLRGQPVSVVTIDAQGKPVRIVAPDPRLFALQKLAMADEPDRRREKKQKDLAQAQQIFQMLEVMPEYPIDEDFLASLHPLAKSAYDTYLGRQASKPLKI